MATSGSVNSGGYQGRCLQFSWGTKSTSADNNTRTINYTITAVGGSSSNYNHHNNTVSINDTNVYTGGSSDYVKTGTVLKSGEFTINQSSTMQLKVEMHGGIYSYGDNINTSKSWDLDEIPRYATLTSLSVKSKTCNSVTLQYTTDKSSNLFCSIDGGNTWLNNGLPFKENTTSGEFTVYYKDRANTSRLDVNTSYTFQVLCRSTASGLDTSKSVKTSTYDIAKLVSVPNADIGSSQTITWNNPSGANISLKLCKTDNSQIINYGTVTGTSKTVTPTASTIYPLTPNSNTYKARYILTTTVNNTSYTNSKDFTFTVTGSNPTFSNFTYADINTTTTNLTKNNQILINGYSNVKVTIPVANKATAKNSATMKSYRLSLGNKSTTANYSSSADVTMNISAINGATMQVFAIDSRDNTTSVSKVATYKNYSQVAIRAVTATRTNNGVGQQVLLSYNGLFWNDNFGADNSTANSITSVTYSFKETTSSTWQPEQSLTPAINGNAFTGTNINIKGDLEAEGFDVSKSFNIRVTVKDKLSTKTYEIILGSGTPALAIYKDRVAIGQKYDTNDGSRLQVNGDVYIHNEKQNLDVIYVAERIDTNIKVGFGIGTDGINHGVWSYKLKKWMLYADEEEAYLNGIANVSLRTASSGKIAAESGTTKPTLVGISMQEAYENGYPNSYGNVLNLRGKDATGCSQLFLGWDSGNAIGAIRYRSMRDSGNDWSSWGRIYTETGLYLSSSGSSGTITLLESVTNFSYIEIFGHTNSGENVYAKVCNANGKTFNLGGGYLATNNIWQEIRARYKVNGTTISKEYEYYINTTSDGGASIRQQGNNVFIDRVVGLR